MTSQNFRNWLLGYFELNSDTLTESQEKIKQMAKSDELDEIALCYFIRGYFELKSTELTKWENIVNDHIDLVLNKITPDRTLRPEPKLKELFEFTKINPSKQIPNISEQHKSQWPYEVRC